MAQNFVRRLSWLLAAAWLASLTSAVRAQEEDEPQLRPGIVATYGEGPHAVQRVEDRVALHRGSVPLVQGAAPSVVTWRGKLFVTSEGVWRLHIFAAGQVRLSLQGEVLLMTEAQSPQWLAAEPVFLPFGYWPVEIQYRPRVPEGLDARCYLAWEGPGVPLEPVAARFLAHEPDQTPAVDVWRGQQLAHALRCGSCHDVPGLPPPPPAPALTRLRGNLQKEWLVDWLAQRRHDARPADLNGGDAPGAQPAAAGADWLPHRMPDFHLSREEAALIAEYLWAASAPPPAANELGPPPGRNGREGGEQKPPPGGKSPAPRAPSATKGRELFLTLGCLACHRLGELGSHTLFDGGDLTHIAAKRPGIDFFVRWLKEPARSNPQHRMPIFHLEGDESTDLAAFLATCGQPRPSGQSPGVGALDNAQRQQAAALVEKFRCAACHELPGHRPHFQPIPLPAAGDAWESACTAPGGTKLAQPRYSLADDAARAIRAYLEGLAAGGMPRRRADDAGSSTPPARHREAKPSGELLLAEQNCLACHARDNAPGNFATTGAVVAAHGELAPLLTAMRPPALHLAGDKLHEGALQAAILAKTPLRPWLSVRMPKFSLTDDELHAVVAHFVGSDRLPDQPGAMRVVPNASPTALRVAGSQLVTSSGFGCVSCHQIGAAVPTKVELKSRGPDLSLLGQRVRRSWYDRFLPDPARAVPLMEMPSLVKPIPGVLDGRLPTQLAAVWHVLNEKDFQPPQPDPIRVVRRGDVNSPRSAAVLTDILEVGPHVFEKPLLLGFANRQNALYDLANASLAGWWPGDAAQQRTRGKSWYWEPAGPALWKIEPAACEFQIILEGKAVFARTSGQFLTEFDELTHVPRGVRFQHRLRFGTGREDVLALTVAQTWTALGFAAGSGEKTSGFRRRLEIFGLPRGAKLRWRPLPAHVVASVDRSRGIIVARDGAFRVVADNALAGALDPAGVVEAASPGPDKALIMQADYVTGLSLEPPLLPPGGAALAAPRRRPRALDVVPGWKAAELPLDEALMPTALAWREDGTLAVASLKGQVFLAKDTDGDLCEDSLWEFSDELAAPYGLAANADGTLDVLNKYALLRLTDADGDLRAEKMTTIASGWGHTRDYHDWAVGLPRDKQGNYYLALPCQQDDRSPAAAHLRGTALKLSPRRPTPDDDRPYAIEVLCRGLRFPMGLVLNQSGDLFATDNQGNYNPFNELNHLRPDKHYGFINKLDFRPDFRPPLEPPAIDIPHPWTRSVNGIALLTGPAAADYGGENVLIGCEYDTRRLVRMSLQRVGDTYQGGVYPFSIEPAAGADSLLGPVCCAVSPRGELYVGNMRDSGWGGGANLGNIVQLRREGPLPAGIAQVRAVADGFVVQFTSPVDAAAASDIRSYAVACYRRVSTPAYGGPDVDRQTVTVQSVRVADDARSVRLKIATLRAGFVYEFHLQNLAPGGGRFFPAEAYYTLRQLVAER